MGIPTDHLATLALPRREPQRVARTVVPCVVLAAAAGSMAFPILPVYSLKAGVGLPLIGVVLAANRIGRIAATPVVGILADRIGARRTLAAGQALQALAMLLYVLGIATPHPVAFFFSGRLLHGVASACVYVSAQVLAVRAGAGRVGGLVRAAMAAGVPLGLMLGGVLSDRFGAIAVFGGAAVATLCGWAAAASMLSDDARPGRAAQKLSWMGRHLADGRLAAIAAMSFAGSFAAHGVVMTTLALLIDARRISVAGLGVEGTSGVMMGWMVLLIALGSPLAGTWGERLRRHDLVAALGLLVCVPALLVTGMSKDAVGMSIGIALIGLSAAALGPSLLALVDETAPPAYQGQSVGVVQLCGDVGGLLGPIVGTAFATHDPGTPYVVSAGLVLFALPAALYLVLGRSRHSSAGTGGRR